MYSRVGLKGGLVRGYDNGLMGYMSGLKGYVNESVCRRTDDAPPW